MYFFHYYVIALWIANASDLNWEKSNKIDQAKSHYFHKFSANLKQEQDDTEPSVI